MLTRRGWWVLAATMGLAAAGWLLGYVELMAIAAGAASTLVLSRLALLRRPTLLVQRQVAPARVARGDPAVAALQITVRGRRGTGRLIAQDRCAGTTIEVPVPSLAPGAAHLTGYPIPTDRRGSLAVGPLTIVVVDPVGLCRMVYRHGAPSRLLVHPRVVPLDAGPVGRATSLDGRESDSAAGTVTFHTLREYVAGDDVRHIHWRSSARTGRLMVRRLVDTSIARAIVVLDTRAEGYADDETFELAVDVAASVALAALRGGSPAEVHTVHGSMFAGGSDTALLDALMSVGRDEVGAGAELAVVLAHVRPGGDRGGLVVVCGAAGTTEAAAVASVGDRFGDALLVRVGRVQPPSPSPAVRVVDVVDLSGFARSWNRR